MGLGLGFVLGLGLGEAGSSPRETTVRSPERVSEATPPASPYAAASILVRLSSEDMVYTAAGTKVMAEVASVTSARSHLKMKPMISPEIIWPRPIEIRPAVPVPRPG